MAMTGFGAHPFHYSVPTLEAKTRCQRPRYRSGLESAFPRMAWTPGGKKRRPATRRDRAAAVGEGQLRQRFRHSQSGGRRRRTL